MCPSAVIFSGLINLIAIKPSLEVVHPEIKGVPIDTLPLEAAAPPFIVIAK